MERGGKTQMIEIDECCWGLSNAGGSDAVIYLQPFAETIILPSRSSIMIRIENRPSAYDLDVEDSDEFITVYASRGDRLEFRIAKNK